MKRYFPVLFIGLLALIATAVIVPNSDAYQDQVRWKHISMDGDYAFGILWYTVKGQRKVEFLGTNVLRKNKRNRSQGFSLLKTMNVSGNGKEQHMELNIKCCGSTRTITGRKMRDCNCKIDARFPAF